MTFRPLAAGAATALAVILIAAAGLPSAHSQPQVSLQAEPPYLPMGVSSSGGTSTAWFHEPSSRTALACQTVQTGGNLSNIQCVKTRLP